VLSVRRALAHQYVQVAPVQGPSHYATVCNSALVDVRLSREVTYNTTQICLYMEIILSDNSHPFSTVKISLDSEQPNDCTNPVCSVTGSLFI
jgi:hypothetical protein